jgi:hypothetical protein
MRISVVAGAAVASIVLVGCLSTDEGDYKAEAEQYIQSDELASNIEEQMGEVVNFTDAECEEPADTETGTTYACTAVNDDGTTWNIEIEIRDDNQLAVIGVEPQT